jgi:ATP-dependent DNA helicase RecG
VFREIGLADELGSGMRNTYKYTKLYSGGTPEFVEGDVFRTTIPLKDMAAGKVGPGMGVILGGDQDTPQDTPQVGIQDIILAFCRVPHSKAEIVAYCGYKDAKSFTDKHLKPLLESNQLKMTIPDKPTSRNQKYIATSQK